MEGSSSRKRPLMETDFDDSNSQQKKVKFPKGKKAKHAPEPLPPPPTAGPAAGPASCDDPVADPRAAAKKRAQLRRHLTTQIMTEEQHLSDLSEAEVQYQASENFVEDGIQIEPFNLNKEREEGYFDSAGNFVEYVGEKEEKDAWLDNLEVDPELAKNFAKLKSKAEEEDEEEEGISSDDIGKMKRRIADVLQPGETVLQALRRLKGNSKEKMSPETKLVFDLLTEDAMKLMENGDYNVYHETQEVFEREAEGYESLIQARNSILSSSKVVVNSSADVTADPSTTEVLSADAETFDMFGDDDDGSKISSSSGHEMSNQASSLSNGTQDPGSLAGQTDYVFDESSGYYYSSSLGYYYDPSSGLYCSASTGIWFEKYWYNEEKNTYEVAEQAIENAS